MTENEKTDDYVHQLLSVNMWAEYLNLHVII